MRGPRELPTIPWRSCAHGKDPALLSFKPEAVIIRAQSAEFAWETTSKKSLSFPDGVGNDALMTSGYGTSSSGREVTH